MKVPYEVPPIWKRLPIVMRRRLQGSAARRWVIERRHRTIKPADVMLASYPKSGNTWLRHLLTFVVTGKSTPWRGGLDKVSHLVGKHGRLPVIAKDGGKLIKTHEPYHCSYRRAIWLVRDARDVAVSEFHFRSAYSKDFYRYEGSFEKFLDAFLDGSSGSYGNWAEHADSWLDAAEGECEVLQIPFQSFKTDTANWLAKIADFIDLDVDESNIAAAIDDCSIASMKQKEADFWAAKGQPNPSFVRGGKTGGWKQHFTPALEEKFWETMGPTMQRLGYQRERLGEPS